MNIYILRHGQTGENKKGVYYGDLDISLNAKGIEQINNASSFFEDKDINKIYRSDRKRTEETVHIILNKANVKCPVLVDSRINETNFGDFEGKGYKELLKLYPEQCKEWIKDWKNFRPPGGEIFVEMYNRVSRFMDDLKSSQDENVLIVTHSGVIRAILCYVMDENTDLFWKFGCSNGDRVMLKYEFENLYIDSITHCS